MRLFYSVPLRILDRSEINSNFKKQGTPSGEAEFRARAAGLETEK